MKLFASYNVFDGIELLESSINQIRELTDIIQVTYQTTSWFNKPVLPDDLDILNDLKNKKLIDRLDCFTNFVPLPNYSKYNIMLSKKYETNKREFGLKSALQEKATHFISLDVDEFYKPIEFYRAKEIIKENNFDLTACKFINYVKTPEYHRGYDPKYVPFICKINEQSIMGNNFFVTCDPTRGISPGKNTFDFNEGLITMHHMEMVRKNLKHKYESTTRLIFDRNKLDTLVNKIDNAGNTINFNGIVFPALKDQTLYKVENYFNINF